ncbi:MAG: lipid II:glycine glycyltransferase FemX [Spirochaetota bacterium]
MAEFKALHTIPLGELPIGPAFMQTPWWGAFKEAAGWTPLATGTPDGSGLLLLHKRLAPGFRLAYVPHGPGLRFLGLAEDSAISSVDELRKASVQLSHLAAALARLLPPDTAIIRFDPDWALARDCFASSDRQRLFNLHGNERPKRGVRLTSKASDIQPPDTVLLDLEQDEESLLAAMKSKWRYNIRLSEKKGVRVRVSTESERAHDLAEFYRLYRMTAVRDRIAIHPIEYYERFMTLAPESFPRRELLCAEHEGEMIAAIMTARTHQTTTYVFGAAADRKRNVMPAYALQWEAIRRAKAAGCHQYDFFGIPPSDDPEHPMHGLYRFKTGFGGVQRMMPGTIDADLGGLRSGAYRLAAGLRMWYYRRFRKKS